MSAYDWPLADADFALESFQPRIIRRVGQSESGYTGRRQYRSVPFTARWSFVLTIPDQTYEARAKVIGFLEKCARPNQIRVPLFHFQAPAGTLRGTPTVASTGAQGARSLAVTTSVSGQGVKQGDLLGVTTAVGPQVLTMTADANAAGTALTLAFESPLRAQVTSGTAVVWNAPRVTCVLAEDIDSLFAASNHSRPMTIALEEDW